MLHGKANWLTSEVLDLLDWVEETSGQSLLASLQKAAAVLSTLLVKAEKEGLDLFETARLFGRLKTCYETHWAREHCGFLRTISQLAPRSPSEAYLLVWGNTLGEEHEQLLELTAALRQATFGYTLAPDATDDEDLRSSVLTLYALLRDIDLDIHRHVVTIDEQLIPQLRGD